MANSILLVIHVLVAVAIVGLVLIQQGRGADMGAAFGGGSQTLFGARGSANFLTRVTAILAAVFFFTSGSLAYLYSQREAPSSVTQGQQQVENSAQGQPAGATTQEQGGSTADSDIPSAPGAQGTGAGSGDVPDAPAGPAPAAPTGEVPAPPAQN